MTRDDWRDLVKTSIIDPALAARTLLAARLPQNALWIGLSLVAVMNTLVFVLTNTLVPGPSPLPGAFDTPIVYLVIVFGGLTATVYALFIAGRFLGGKGSFADVMAIVVWMQALRLLVQIAALVLLLIMPLLSALLIFAAALYGLFIMLHFVNQAHQLDSLGRAAGVIIASAFGIAVGLTLLLTLLGGMFSGSLGYV